MNPGDCLQLGPIILPTRTLWPISSSSILVSDRTDFHPPSKWALFGFCLTHVRPLRGRANSSSSRAIWAHRR
ncbi:hypothetical protein FIBSPDRAFT_876747, partial [Athelia psychrophila]